MEDYILKVENLSINYKREQILAVRDLSLAIKPGESVGLIGESGSGKSSTALAIMGLLQSRAEVQGRVWFRDIELTGLAEQELSCYRWSRIAIVFQNGLDVLNPVMTVGEQIGEALKRHRGIKGAVVRERTEKLFSMVGLEPSWLESYPHQLSGGMRQKVLIAMALSCEPDVLLVDEPTMSLDTIAKEEIVKLLLRLKEEKCCSMLVISHELPVISAMTSRILVMYSGNIVEEGATKEVLNNPMHPYTRGLIYASPAVNPYRDMWGIPGEYGLIGSKQCSFFSRCNQRIGRCAEVNPTLQPVCKGRRVACCRGGIVTLLSGKAINKNYILKDKTVAACSSCNIEVKMGEVTALVGESGSGKTTMAEILAGIIKADCGEVVFENREVCGNKETSRTGGIQMVFQDPLTATNESFTIEEIVREPLDIIRWGTKYEREQAVRDALKNVQLPYDNTFLKRRGFSLSGGQRQRVAIARALVMKPKLLIADEISAMLDPSTSANLLRLLKGLQIGEGFAMLYISHDLALVQKIADKIYVMHNGRIIEHGPVGIVLRCPKEEYTKNLMCSAGIVT